MEDRKSVENADNKRGGMTYMVMIIKGLTYPVIGLLFAALVGLFFIYSIDVLHEIFANGKVGLICIGIFFGPIWLLVIYWGGMLAMMPLSLASADEASPKERLLGIALAPVGLVAGFLLWQVENALTYGLLGVEPWLYNKIFDPISLAV
jgi:hypothetical protein